MSYSCRTITVWIFATLFFLSASTAETAYHPETGLEVMSLPHVDSVADPAEYQAIIEQLPYADEVSIGYRQPIEEGEAIQIAGCRGSIFDCTATGRYGDTRPRTRRRFPVNRPRPDFRDRERTTVIIIQTDDDDDDNDTHIGDRTSRCSYRDRWNAYEWVAYDDVYRVGQPCLMGNGVWGLGVPD